MFLKLCCILLESSLSKTIRFFKIKITSNNNNNSISFLKEQRGNVAELSKYRVKFLKFIIIIPNSKIQDQNMK